MKVSIITTCFNRERTIAQAVESVLAQDYPDIEYIVVDGASTDGSLQVIRQYDGQISRVLSEPDHGMYEAINKGIRMVTGEVIGLLHSDDFLFDSHVISDMAECFQRTGADLVYGNGLFVDAAHTERVVRNWMSGPYRRWKVRCGWLPLHPTCLYETRLRVEYMNRYIVRMRMGGLSTDSVRRKQMWREDVAIYREHGFPGVWLKLMKMGWKVPQFF